MGLTIVKTSEEEYNSLPYCEPHTMYLLDNGKFFVEGIEYGSGEAFEVDDYLSEDSENPVQNKVIYKEIDELKKSVSDGKKLVADAITYKGVDTAADDEFSVMADNIIKIEGGEGNKIDKDYISDLITQLDNDCGGIDESIIPYFFCNGSAVVYNNEIHIFGGFNSSDLKKHYKWDGLSWTSVSTLPYSVLQYRAVVCNNEIHMLGFSGSDNNKLHYKFDGNNWVYVSTMPYNNQCVVYNNEIHIISKSSSDTKALFHYKWDGSSWTMVSTLSFSVNLYNYYLRYVVNKGQIHLFLYYLYGFTKYCDKYYKWDGASWTNVSTFSYNDELPIPFSYNNEIYMYDDNIFYKCNEFGLEKVFCSSTGYTNSYTIPVVYNNKIHVLGEYIHRTLHMDKSTVNFLKDNLFNYINMFNGVLSFNLIRNTLFSYNTNMHGHSSKYYNNIAGIKISEAPTDYSVMGSAVVYNNEIHIFGGYDKQQIKHYKWDGISWTEASTLSVQPYDTYCSALVYNDEIHLLSKSVDSNDTYHYKWNGQSWSRASVLPYNFYLGTAVVYNDEIHMLGGNEDNPLLHYKWNGSSWIEVSTLPYNVKYSSAVVYNNEIHILSGYSSSNSKKHYKWDGLSWTSVSTLPYDCGLTVAVVYNNEIRILSGYKYINTSGDGIYSHYEYYCAWNGETWTQLPYLPCVSNKTRTAVVYNNGIHTIMRATISTGRNNSYKNIHYDVSKIRRSNICIDTNDEHI